MMNGSFWVGFLKRASPRWIKEIRKLKQVPEGMADKLKSLNLPLRETRRIGSGASQLADEVFHPVHGVSVRKIPVGYNAKDREVLKAKARNDIAMWEHARHATGGKGPFAHIKGHEGHVAFYEKAMPSAKDRGPRLRRLIPKAHALAEMHSAIPGHSRQEWRAFDLSVKLKKKSQEEVSFSGRDQEYIDRIKEKYPELHDLRHSNIVGGKIVDMEPGGDLRIRLRGSDDYKNPVSEAKKHFAAETRAAQKQRSDSIRKVSARAEPLGR